MRAQEAFESVAQTANEQFSMEVVRDDDVIVRSSIPGGGTPPDGAAWGTAKMQMESVVENVVGVTVVVVVSSATVESEPNVVDGTLAG